MASNFCGTNPLTWSRYHYFFTQAFSRTKSIVITKKHTCKNDYMCDILQTVKSICTYHKHTVSW